MNKYTKVTHVIPCYNVSMDEIRRTLSSIYYQMFDDKVLPHPSKIDIEIILVNDGKNEEWWNKSINTLLPKYSKDKRLVSSIKKISTPSTHKGTWNARYYGYKKATGDIVFSVDAGDTLPCNADCRILRDFNKYGCDILGISYYDLTYGGIVIKSYSKINFNLNKKPVTPVYTRSLILNMLSEVPLIDNYIYSEDILELFVCSILSSNYHVQTNPDSPMYTYYYGGISTDMTSRTTEWYESQLAITRSWIEKLSDKYDIDSTSLLKRLGTI